MVTYITSRFFAVVMICCHLASNVDAQIKKSPKAPELHASVCPYYATDIPETKLLHFDSPSRIDNQYLVTFKCDESLAKDIADPTSLQSQVLPDKLPTSQANCTALASAYVARFGGHLGGVWCKFNLRAFSITDISESAIADLAKDSRIEYVEPNMRTTAN